MLRTTTNYNTYDLGVTTGDLGLKKTGRFDVLSDQPETARNNFTMVEYKRTFYLLLALLMRML